MSLRLIFIFDTTRSYRCCNSHLFTLWYEHHKSQYRLQLSLLQQQKKTVLNILIGHNTARSNRCCNRGKHYWEIGYFSHNTARSNRCCNFIFLRRKVIMTVTIPLAVIAVATECSSISRISPYGHNTARSYRCCNRVTRY